MLELLIVMEGLKDECFISSSLYILRSKPKSSLSFLAFLRGEWRWIEGLFYNLTFFAESTSFIL